MKYDAAHYEQAAIDDIVTANNQTGDTDGAFFLARAQVNATLALAAATVGAAINIDQATAAIRNFDENVWAKGQ